MCSQTQQAAQFTHVVHELAAAGQLAAHRKTYPTWHGQMQLDGWCKQLHG